MDVNTELTFLWWLTNSVIRQNKYIDADVKIGEMTEQEAREMGQGESNSHLTESSLLTESNCWTMNLHFKSEYAANGTTYTTNIIQRTNIGVLVRAEMPCL